MQILNMVVKVKIKRLPILKSKPLALIYIRMVSLIYKFR